jgi:SAM-dependent methyltransferase
MAIADPTDLAGHDWGSAPDLYGPRHEYREALVLRELLPATPGPRILNAGSGAGSLTLRLADLGLRTTSIDASPELCELTRSLLEERHPGGRHLVRFGDVSRLGLSDGSFDGVVAAEVLEHVDDDRAALSEIHRVLRPGGVLVVTVPVDPFRYDWTDLWAGHRRRYTREGLAERLRAAGFEVERVRSWGFPLSRAFHELAFRPALRRRLERGPASEAPAPSRSAGVAKRVVRAALELDTLVGDRGPGVGLIALARRPADPSPRPGPG